ncbi:hypothetical protein CBS101457_002854 [Exobasidium rhododendri]|nr:hypothetical protein CBS101457_002854 [Exobasidium rhododendri]
MSSSISASRADEATAPSSSLFDSISSAFSSFFPVAHADEGEDDEGGDDGKDEGGEKEEGGDDKEEEGGDAGGEEEEEDDDEPEDIMPGIYEDCENSKECSPAKHHFLECQERVEAGNGFKDENCVEEFPPRSLC